jgi:hypothetical protein
VGRPVKLPEDVHTEIDAALKPLIEGRRVFATKTYYLFTTDGVTLDVGVHCSATNEAQLAALAAVVREEAELGDLRHAEHFPTSFVRNQPTRH